MSQDLSRDAFLGGRLHLWQPVSGFRAGVDSVLLAASVPASPGQSVLELGCGVGAAILCLGARVPALKLTGVEVQPLYADLAARNGGGALEVIAADIANLPDALRQRQFDHVIANPPYFDRRDGHVARDTGRETAHGERTPLATWIEVAARRLAPKGCLHVIHRVERLPDLLCAATPVLGSIEVQPISARPGRRPERMIVRARKGGRSAFKLHAPLVMHEGRHHDGDRDSYVPAIQAVLRDAAPLDFGSAEFAGR
ncbi:methyltransferase [Sulfitobacter sp. D35]|uniref:tRNA1(Val) (adenine(37)-N6)-methyltransferase n=1 Tax=Sulfitobacter sp. D35 TaxID=3083252 RepID=UPI00296F6F6F|nr:methyltransferase [Sulfitobacter sp. D35]MDW4499796.1 methyltransferase [Sulfitobacter sp. D35]